MNRCSNCKNVLRFYGISVQPSWLRWSVCDTCDVFTVANSAGKILRTQKQEPPKEIFRGQAA